MFVFDKKNDCTTSGVWAEFGGSKFLISHHGSAKFQRLLNRLQQPHRRKIEKGTLDPVEGKNMLCKAMAEGLIHDWSNVVDSSGQVTPFSAEKCEIALQNNDEFREFVQEFSQSMENYKVEDEKEMGNGSLNL